MKFLCFTDYGGASEILPLLPKAVQAEEPDYLFFCGGSMKGEKRRREYETARKFHSKPDLSIPEVQREIEEDTEHLRRFLLALADTHKPLFVVPGYQDAPESLYFKTVYNYARIYPNLHPTHEMLHREDQFMVAGFGGDLGGSDDNREFMLQYSRVWVEFALRRLEYYPGEKILIFHSPPVSRLDRSEESHCGVLFINELIEKLNPRLVLCGRSLDGQGAVQLGPAKVVHPGPLRDGHYAVIDYPSLEVQFRNLRAIPT